MFSLKDFKGIENNLGYDSKIVTASLNSKGE
jgi:hypothetical protein